MDAVCFGDCADHVCGFALFLSALHAWFSFQDPLSDPRDSTARILSISLSIARRRSEAQRLVLPQTDLRAFRAAAVKAPPYRASGTLARSECPAGSALRLVRRRLGLPPWPQ